MFWWMVHWDRTWASKVLPHFSHVLPVVLGAASKSTPAKEEQQLSAPWGALSPRYQTEIPDHQGGCAGLSPLL